MPNRHSRELLRAAYHMTWMLSIFGIMKITDLDRGRTHNFIGLQDQLQINYATQLAKYYKKKDITTYSSSNLFICRWIVTESIPSND
ncbi:hypothetical protein TNCV_3026641 [Trichonephila clavipes]|nr:hypothetical protein TNCV_3026641 [Trichonephila clavipes]